MNQIVILAGGMGTRLKARLGDLPKPLIPIEGKPLLEHQIELARRFGFTRITLLVCYRPDLIQARLGDGRRWGVDLEYVVEDKPRGTAGAVLAAWRHLDESFVVMYGDTLLNVDLSRFVQAHRTAEADATLLIHPNNHPFDSDLVECGDDHWITQFHNRPHPPSQWFQNLVNAGLYAIQRSALEPFKESGLAASNAPSATVDFGKDLFPSMLRSGARLLGYSSPEYIKDIGTPERYDKACREAGLGVVARSSFATAAPAVFLDRDGTLNRDADGVRSADQFELLPGVAAAVQEFNQAGLRVVVVTNQPVIAKGFTTERELATIHRKMETLLGREHAFVDRIYYCPHHPDRGFAGERLELKTDCECRKPKPGMILQAAKDMNLDLTRSWMVGDTTTDVQCARNAGVKSILVRTGHGGRDGRYSDLPYQTVDTLNDAARFILEQTSTLR